MPVHKSFTAASVLMSSEILDEKRELTERAVFGDETPQEV